MKLRIKSESRTRIIDMLLSHAETHPSCYISLSVLFKLAATSEDVLQYIRKDKFLALLAVMETVAMKTTAAK